MSPTGTGKSLVLLKLLESTHDAFLVVPRLEIAADMLAKTGVTEAGTLGVESLVARAQAQRIWLPTRLQNRLLAGEVTPPAVLLIDEMHHDEAETYDRIDALCGGPVKVGLTATYFRGTPKGTASLHASWPEVIHAITIREAVDAGYLSFPTCRLVPLVDDDEIEVQNGEFVVSQIESLVSGTFGRIVEISRPFYAGDSWDRPTMFAVPSVRTAKDLAATLTDNGLPCVVVTGETPRAERVQAFADTVAGRVALVQVFVVSEGVDLPIRRLIDLAPRISPVAFLQLLGRIERPVPPGEPPPEYVGCCRNLLRHAYLLDGVLPPAAFKDAVAAFPPSKRLGLRVVGFEGLGRFKATDVPCVDGLTATAYCLSTVEGLTVTQYACVAHPLLEEVVWAKRNHVRSADGDVTKTAYGRWRACPPPTDLSGFASVPPSPLTDKMRAWWKRDAGRYGLDPAADVNRRQFQMLPILADLRTRVSA